jgi:hypothetical protein
MPRHLTRPLLFAAVVASFAVAAASASASGGLLTSLIGGNCGSSLPVFAPWGDQHSYYLATDGGFESGGAGWTFSSGAQVVSGNEPFHVHAASDASSLSLPSGSMALSPALCFGVTTPGIRFFASSANGATVHVRVVARGLLGVLTVLDGGTVTVGPSWAPTPVFSTLGSQLNALVGAKSIQIELSSTGDAQIDDVYIDPFFSR